MTDYSNPNCLTLISGRSGTCKTSLAFAYLINVPAACVFIFDDRGQAASRLKLRACGTEAECNAALATRFVCFNPHICFPGAMLRQGFFWFLNWVFEVSKRGPGRKILFVDELWQWSNARQSVPPELENIVRTGRIEGLELVSATHSPKEYHELIRSQATEFIAFNTVEPAQLESIEPYWPGVYAAANLQRGQFIAFNRDSGGILKGQMDPGWPPGKFRKI